MPLPAYEEQADLAATCAVLGITVEDIKRELDFRMRKKMARMHAEMALAAKAGGVRRVLKDDGHGGGDVAYMVHPISFHFWGHKKGYECWQDDEFVREYLRDNPAARIKTSTAAKPWQRKLPSTATRIAARPTSTGRGRWGTR